MLLSLASRVLLGYLIFEFDIFSRAKAASFDLSNTESCNPDSIQQFLSENHGNTDNIQAIYERCREQFLSENEVSLNVKQTVDEWIGTDLSKADANEIFLAYQLAIFRPKPENTSEEFTRDCELMFNRFEAYCEATEPLTYYVDNNIDSMLADGDTDRKSDEQERDLINFVQYTQLCKSILQD